MSTMTNPTTRTTDVQRIVRHLDIDFSTTAGWETLAGHVVEHRELLNREFGVEPQWHEAVFSWYENVFMPLYRVISQWGYRHAFGKEPVGDLYLAVSDHWGYLKERNPDITAPAAARSFLDHYGPGLGRYFSRFLVSDLL